MKEHVYLIGPIEDCTVEHMRGWRIEAGAYLEEVGVPVYDPTRRIPFHDQIGDTVQDTHRSMNICKRIFKQDLQDIAQSRVVLADIRRNSGRGTGSSMELLFAHTQNKIIILWADPEDQIHPFMEAIATEKHYVLEDALRAVATYY